MTRNQHVGKFFYGTVAVVGAYATGTGGTGIGGTGIGGTGTGGTGTGGTGTGGTGTGGTGTGGTSCTKNGKTDVPSPLEGRQLEDFIEDQQFYLLAAGGLA
jgi:hypothetical protein